MIAQCDNLTLDVILYHPGKTYYKGHYGDQQAKLEYEW